ncbi:conjugal transfer protein [Pseudomonas mosselii]|uniref:VirB4 family type IV secretion system protein n=1 Tax=Pseudomonas mosselii TaxID=78327 RepID=UPI002612330B|nr:conjugal transfer protein [Pseudomonas mosselii]MDN4500154.1 conjugal transfer protein [Pseudomonas mosselii]
MHNSTLDPEKMKVLKLRYAVTEHIHTMEGQRLLAMVRFKGISNKFRTPEELHNLVLLEENFFTTLAKRESKNLTIQTYTTKSKIEFDASYALPVPVLQDFVNEYVKPFRTGAYRKTDYTMALILKYSDLDEGIQRMQQLIVMTESMLEPFQPTFLGLEDHQANVVISQVGRFLSQLFNGHEQEIECSDTRLGDSAIDSVTSFAAYDFVECRANRGGVRYATTFDLRGYPRKTKAGMWNEAIEQPYDFTLVQTFVLLDRVAAKTKFLKQGADLGSIEGETKQVRSLDKASQRITEGELAFGSYHAALVVYGDTPKEAVANGSKMESVFAVRNANFVRSTVTNVYSYYALFPGFTNAVYPMVKSTENLACGFSLHNTPTGKAKGNPIGDGTALMPVATDTMSLFLLNAHDSPSGQNNLGEQLPGHIAVTGQTGAGKTTLEAIMLTFMSRWDNMLFGLDYNHSLQNLALTLGTHYYTIKPGVNTGINPFQLPDSPNLRQLLFDTVVTCAGGADDKEEKEIHKAIEAVMGSREVKHRGMSLLIQGLPDVGGNCLRTRLAKWCRLTPDGSGIGHNAWVLDSPVNKFDPTQYRRLMFDCTAVLKKTYVDKHPEVMEVLLNLLFYLKQLMHESEPGALLVNFIAEYWVPLSFESTAERIKEILKAGRTRGEILMMDTQSPEDAIATKYAPAVIQQVITSIWLPNDKADAEGYAKFGITGKLFEELKKMRALSREMLVLQGGQAVKLKLDLGAKQADGSESKLKYWLPLLSSDSRNLAVAEATRRSLGTDDPAVWVPVFLERWAELQAAKREAQS